MTTNIDQVRNLANNAAIYIQLNCEAIRIDYCNDEEACFYGSGEESGEEYRVEYTEVDLDNDIFYRLVLMDNHNGS